MKFRRSASPESQKPANGKPPCKITVALAGNPNSGKTTLFNAITGSSQHVGNYHGVTVEKKTGRKIHKGCEIAFVDLPGTYSLGTHSLEEKVARDFIVNEKPDLIVDVIDSTNLERNLLLAAQILELGFPMVIVLNMYDEAQKMGIKINLPVLRELLGTRVVATVASQEEGINELLDEILEAAFPEKKKEINIFYGSEMEDAIASISKAMLDESPLVRKYPKRWISIKLLENDSEITEQLSSNSELIERANKARSAIEDILGNTIGDIVANQRYGFVAGVYHEAAGVTTKGSGDLTEKVDSLLANRILGLPIFFFLMWLAFQLTFRIGAYPVNWIDSGIHFLGTYLAGALPQGFISSMVVDGIIGGVGGVVIFLPNILLLFLVIAFLEDTGYMARAAFIMDRIMHLIGLHGKSFIPMLVGFGCSVPAIMATRTLENPKDRLTTMLVVPLMSCGARLPIYILLAGTFFSDSAGDVIFVIYLLGIFLAFLMALIFKKFLFQGLSSPFVMELPPYRVPTLKRVVLHAWQRGYCYLRKAGTVILLASLVIWLANWVRISNPQVDPEYQRYYPTISIAEFLGKSTEPLIKPLGFNWKVGVALISGVAAKEMVVSSLGTTYAINQSDEKSPELRKALLNDTSFTPLVAFCLMVFTLIYIPCIAAVTTIFRESGSVKWTAFAVLYTTSLAWIVTFAVRHVGFALGFH